MVLSDSLRQLIDQGLLATRGDADHRLKPILRLAIYQALSSPADVTIDRYKIFLATGKLDITLGLQRYNNLQYYAAKYVLPIWDHGMIGTMNSGEVDPMRKILGTVEGVIDGKIDPIYANELFIGDYYYQIDSSVQTVTYGGWLALCAAYKALGNVLGNVPFYRVNEFVWADVDENKIPFSNDTALDAVAAYSALSDASPGIWSDAYFSKANFQFDKQKRLEFWEWWLTEAVPAAWNSVKEQA